MIRIENRLGTVRISPNFFAQVVSHAASGCFGVAGLVASPTQGLRGLTGGKVPDKGVQVRVKNGKLEVSVHIVVAYGVNIAVVVRSLISEVRYAVESAASLKVDKVKIYVDGMVG